MSKSDTNDDAGTASRLTDVRGQTGTYHAYHDPSGETGLSETVIEAIADVANVDPTTTIIPLAEHVDPDALDALFDGRGASGGYSQVRLSLCGLEVVAHADGHVRIRNAPVPEDDR
ncbi:MULTISPECIES: HalOD1 output domain-containing protein [Halorussus]|uniref:HalOD1 output domain-containing protein n=1 Tax=Halorussus TaxID=1070314 RepID=UPI00209E9CC7|nr:HalOD1 output domain-containing protein [Halorussus vallis]USZ76623.1 hypothetical protein NGM07_04675 [Halorussus vallis]